MSLKKIWTNIENWVKDGIDYLGDGLDNIGNGIKEFFQNSGNKERPSLEEAIDDIESIPKPSIPPNIYDNLEKDANIFFGGKESGGKESAGIIDTTGQNEEYSFQDIIEKAQKEQWAREDEIRKETQAREDTAYQRSVEDMRKAGINPNLVGVTPAQSGGGITQATEKDYTLYQAEIEKALTEMENILDRELKADENTKDRIASIIETTMQLGMLFILKKK